MESNDNLIDLRTARLARRFWTKVDISAGPSGCWTWTAFRSENGYGRMCVPWGRGWEYTHRLSYLLNRGAIPPNMVVMHVCDNPPCVNPRHLCLGTPGENIADCFAKGRRSTPHGENGYNAKLTAAQVAEIRRTYDGRRGSQTRIAREFGVSIATIHDIVHGRSWKEAA